MSNQFIRSEPSYLYHSALMCSELKGGSDGMWQVAPFQCTIPYSSKTLDLIDQTKLAIRQSLPDLYNFGESRAKRAYNYKVGTITKPSYTSRLIEFGVEKINQIQSISNIAAREKGSGGLVFSVFTPEDLVQRKRPGYIPCLVSGSFIEHAGELQMNAFFRSQSVLEFGIFDIEHLRKLQISTASRISADRDIELRIGSLNLHFSRVIIQRRVMRNRNGYISRDEIFGRWISAIEEIAIMS